MSTTDPSLPAVVLRCFELSGIRFAILHGESKIASNQVVSDVDLVMGVRPSRAVRLALPALRKAGVHPILVWPYDVGGAVTVFFSSADGSAGAQFDLLYDPAGKGKEGIRTDVLLVGAMVGDRWPKVNEVHEILYLIRKRHRKEQTAELERLIEVAAAMDQVSLGGQLMGLFPTSVGSQMLSIISGNGDLATPPRRPQFYQVRNLVRRVQRIRSPIGFWAAAGSRESAERLSRRFGRFLPHSGSAHLPAGWIDQLKWYTRTVGPIRWRPGLFVSWPAEPSWLKPDGFTKELNLTEASQALVEQMESKVVREFLS